MRKTRVQHVVPVGFWLLCWGGVFGWPAVSAQDGAADDPSKQEAVLTDIEEVVGEVERFLQEEEKKAFEMPDNGLGEAATPSHVETMKEGSDASSARETAAAAADSAPVMESARDEDAGVGPDNGGEGGADIQTQRRPWWRRWVGRGRTDRAAQVRPAARSAPGNYWDEDIGAQNLDGLRRHQRFKEVYEEAKRFEVPKPAKDEPEEEPPPVILTTSEILQRVIPPDRLNQKVDLEFSGAKLGEILMTLGDAGGVNIVLDPALPEKPFNLHLKGVRLEEALKLIADAYDLGFKPVGSSLFITDKEKLKNENLTARIIKLRNLNVQEAKDLVEDMVSVINVSEEINSVLVIDEPEKVAEVEGMLKRIDNPQPQVIIEAKIIELNKDALKDLGVDWSDAVNILYQESGRPVDFDDPEDASRGVFEIARLQRNALQFTNVLRMLENQNKAKVLATPKITTLNNKEAEIFVGDRVPYTVTTVSGGVATTDVRFEEPGIRLKITPSIIDKDFVVLKVEPEVSFIFTFRGPNDEFPQTRIRKATAYVRVKNGQPFVLGGLLNQEDKKNLYKVPMIGDVPLIGNLFKYQKDTLVDTELLITIVPTIVYGDV